MNTDRIKIRHRNKISRLKRKYLTLIQKNFDEHDDDIFSASIIDEIGTDN